MIRLITDFSAGFFYPFRGLRTLAKTPKLWGFVLIPFVINLLIFALGVTGGFHLFSDFVLGLMPQTETWYWTALAYLIWTLTAVLAAALVFFVFTLVGNLIASPFNELLSEKVEERFFDLRQDGTFSLGGFLREAPAILFDEGRRLGGFVLGLLVLLLLNLVPLAGPVLYLLCSGLFTLFFLVLEFMSYPMGRRNIFFRERCRWIMARKFLMGGFGCGVLCLLLVPFVQFFTIPAVVTAATLLWAEKELPVPE